GRDPDGETAAFFNHFPSYRSAPPLQWGGSCPALPQASKSDSVQTASGPDRSVGTARCKRADKGYPPGEHLCGKWDIAWREIRRKPASPPIESGPAVIPQEAASLELPAQQSFVPPGAIPDRSPALPGHESLLATARNSRWNLAGQRIARACFLVGIKEHTQVIKLCCLDKAQQKLEILFRFTGEPHDQRRA